MNSWSWIPRGRGEWVFLIVMDFISLSLGGGEMSMKRIARIFLVSFFLHLACNAQQEGREERPVRVEQFTASNVEVTLNYHDQRLLPLDDQIKHVTRSAFTEITTLFGGLPKDRNGHPYRHFEINLRYGDPEADADPNVINLRLNEASQNKPVFSYIPWTVALIHEMFHFWNAETFRYASGREQWFNEGVTEYYAFRIAIKIGLIAQDDIPSRLGMPIGYYLSDSGTGTMSMSEAGVGESKFRHYFLVYSGGLVAGMVLDYDIRARTNRSKTLDDLMRAMYLKFNRTDGTYTTLDILGELNRVTGRDYSQFFARYIRGTDIIPVGRYFNIADLYFINNPRRFDPTSQQGIILKEMFHLTQR